MRFRTVLRLLFSVIFSIALNAEISIRAGVNIANETKLFENNRIQETFKTENLNGFNVGLMYQKLSKKGFGMETGILFSQKGSNFSYADSTNATIRGYNNVNYLEVPLNFKYIFRTKFLGIYAAVGIYGACAFLGKTTLEEESEVEKDIQYRSFKNRLDTGYNIGGGIELFKKIQLGATWSQSLLNMSTIEGISTEKINTSTRNKVCSVTLAYFF